MCPGCWVAADPEARGCPACQKWPKSQSRADGLCGNCVASAAVAAKREARRAELAQLCDDEGIEEGPADVKDAAFRTRYVVLNHKDDHKPYVSGAERRQWTRACAVRGCVHQADLAPGTPNTHCIGHGGGHRCAVEGAHLVEVDEQGFAPWAGHVLSDAVRAQRRFQARVGGDALLHGLFEAARADARGRQGARAQGGPDGGGHR